MIRLVIILISIYSFSAIGKSVATFSKKGSKKVESISIDELKSAYQTVVSSTLNAPAPKQFIEDYLRYRIAVEEAYNDKTLVRSPNIKNMIVNNIVKENFNQILYKAVAHKKMQEHLDRADKETKNISDTQLKVFYNRNPYYTFQYIVISLPVDVTRSKVRAIKKRADLIYSKVIKSKKPFNQLIRMYSDNPLVGQGLISHSQASLYPLLYQKLKSLKRNQMSAPIQTPNGFYITKLIEIVPFQKANKNDIKNQYFAVKKSEVFNNYFNNVKSKYNININNQVLKTL